jgi:hypothetical protein
MGDPVGGRIMKGSAVGGATVSEMVGSAVVGGAPTLVGGDTVGVFVGVRVEMVMVMVVAEPVSDSIAVDTALPIA